MQFVSPILWTQARDKIGDKTPIGSELNSEQWRDVPLALRERAFFSSQVESIRFLQRARDFIGDYLSQTIETLPDGQTAIKAGGRSQFVRDLSEFAVSEVMGPLDASDAGTLKDITSEGRLNLIFDVMTQSANDYTYWRQGMNPDVLDAFPAQRFIRERDVKTPRPVHQENEGVVRLKSDLDFWLAMNDPSIGGFGVPWGPWGFGSGMGVDDVARDEAEATGILAPGEEVQPVEKDFNEHLEASTRGLDDDMLAKLKDDFGDQVEFGDDTVQWVGTPKEEAAPEVAPEKELETEPEAAAPDTLESILADLGLDAEQSATAGDMVQLREQLKEADPVDAQSIIKYIRGSQPAGALVDEAMQTTVQEFLDYIPPDTARNLPKLKIEIQTATGHLGSYGMGGTIKLNNDLLANDPDRARRTIFHELMHWVHREGDQDYRDAIQNHFEERTAGDRVKRIPDYRGMRGKTDDWYEPYAGVIYPFETDPGGLEVPTRYIEWLTMSPEKMADFWNRPSFRETMKIMLQGLF